MIEATKEAFLRTWPGGYRENWVVYGKMSGVSEDALVAATLSPFYDPAATCMEIGCGLGFWTDRYLAPHFGAVVALDLLQSVKFKHKNIRYIEVPDRSYSCHGVEDDSVDFCWSFGVFCHIPLPRVQEYLRAIFRKCKRGARCSLYFSNIERRPGTVTAGSDRNDIVPWVENDWRRTCEMLEAAGFVDIVDLLPTLPDTMASCKKP